MLRPRPGTKPAATARRLTAALCALRANSTLLYPSSRDSRLAFGPESCIQTRPRPGLQETQTTETTQKQQRLPGSNCDTAHTLSCISTQPRAHSVESTCSPRHSHIALSDKHTHLQLLTLVPSHCHFLSVALDVSVSHNASASSSKAEVCSCPVQ